jgi:hypothetical protein
MSICAYSRSQVSQEGNLFDNELILSAEINVIVEHLHTLIDTLKLVQETS